MSNMFLQCVEPCFHDPSRPRSTYVDPLQNLLGGPHYTIMINYAYSMFMRKLRESDISNGHIMSQVVWGAALQVVVTAHQRPSDRAAQSQRVGETLRRRTASTVANVERRQRPPNWSMLRLGRDRRIPFDADE